MALVSLFVLWPTAQLIVLSFAHWNGYDRITFAGLSTWQSLASDGNFQAALHNTFMWTVWATIIPVGLGLAMAVACAYAGRWGNLGRAVAIAPILIPATVAATIWHIIYSPLYGPLDGTLQAWGLSPPGWLFDPAIALQSVFAVAVWSTMGFSVLIFTAAIRSIDRSYLELCRSEGGGFFAELRTVVLPACRRSIPLAVIVSLIIASQVEDLLLGLHTNGGPGTATLLLPLDMYIRAFNGFTNLGEAAGEATLLIVLIAAVAGAAMLLVRRDPGLVGDAEFAPLRPRTIAKAGVAAGTIIVGVPLWWMIMATLFSGHYVELSPVDISLRPLAATLNPIDGSPLATAWNSPILGAMWQSLQIAGGVVAVTLLVSLPAALGIHLIRSQLVKVGLLVFVSVALLQPGDVAVIPLYYLMLQLHLLDTARGLMVSEIARAIPFTILLIWMMIQTLPRDILAAATIDVGTGWRYLTRVIAPMTWPACACAALWVFVMSWSEYALAYQLLPFSGLETAPLALSSFADTHDTQFNAVAAASLLVIVPVMIGFAAAYGPAGRALSAAGGFFFRTPKPAPR